MIGNLKISTKIAAASTLTVIASLAAGYTQSQLVMFVTGATLLVFGFLIAGGITRPVALITEGAEQLAQGLYDVDFGDGHISGRELQKLAGSMRRVANHVKDEAAIAKSIQLSIESPFFMADKNTVVTYMNRSACELMHVRPEDVVGKVKVYDLFGSDRATRSALSGKPLSAYEVNITNWEKESIPVIASSGPIRKANGEITGSFFTFIDMRASIQKQREYLEQQIKPIEDAVRAIASGDLTSTIEISEESQLQELGMEVDRMIRSLKATLTEVSQTSTAVADASAQISSSTEELSAGAQEQSTQTSDVAAAVEEMTRTVIENSKNATLTADIAKKNGVVAKAGGDIVAQTVRKIKEIAGVVQSSAEIVERLGSSTQEIGEIVRVIDDIADQTNLLALNAAIEAARAGEEGRGFAVVADEVKKLAERTTNATKQIAAMIRNVQSEAKVAVQSMKKGSTEVSEGIRLADEAGESLKNIVGNTDQVVDMMMQIAAASEEQSSTSEQISQNVESISTVASESAIGISQIARSADDLKRLTESLQTLVMNFRLEKRGRYEPDPMNQPFRTRAERNAEFAAGSGALGAKI